MHLPILYTKNKNLCPERILTILTNKYPSEKLRFFGNFCKFSFKQKSRPNCLYNRQIFKIKSSNTKYLYILSFYWIQCIYYQTRLLTVLWNLLTINMQYIMETFFDILYILPEHRHTVTHTQVIITIICDTIYCFTWNNYKNHVALINIYNYFHT